MWEDLLRAVALMMVIEGILPFLNPMLLRDAMDRLQEMDDRTLRIMGLLSMLIGVGFLYALHD